MSGTYDLYGNKISPGIDEGTGGLSNDAKVALLSCFRHVAFLDKDEDYYGALEAALYASDVQRIRAVYTQTYSLIPNDTLDIIKKDLVVYAQYEDETESEITDYSLSGNLVQGESTVKITYLGKETTISVNVSASRALRYEDVESHIGVGLEVSSTGDLTLTDPQQFYCLMLKTKIKKLSMNFIGGTVSGLARQLPLLFRNDDGVLYGVDPGNSNWPSKVRYFTDSGEGYYTATGTTDTTSFTPSAFRDYLSAGQMEVDLTTGVCLIKQSGTTKATVQNANAFGFWGSGDVLYKTSSVSGITVLEME